MFESNLFACGHELQGTISMENQMFYSIVMVIVCLRSSKSSHAEIHNPSPS